MATPELDFGELDRLMAELSRLSLSVWVKVEPAVRALLECLSECEARGETDGGRSLVGERGVGIAGRVQLGGDAAPREHGVPGGRRPGRVWFGPLVASCPGLVGGLLDRAGGVTGRGQARNQLLGADDVVERELRPAVPDVGAAEGPAS